MLFQAILWQLATVSDSECDGRLRNMTASRMEYCASPLTIPGAVAGNKKRGREGKQEGGRTPNRNKGKDKAKHADGDSVSHENDEGEQ